MAELTARERLQPSLLDRLTDEEPSNRQESRDRRVLSQARLRESVKRDLGWLFNTANLASVQDLSTAPQVANSVLNYGVRALAGRLSGSVDATMLERGIREAIWQFEPRLMRNSVKVTVELDRNKMAINALTFFIEADLWGQPLPLRLYLRTDIDLESGNVRVSEQSGGP